MRNKIKRLIRKSVVIRCRTENIFTESLLNCIDRWQAMGLEIEIQYIPDKDGWFHALIIGREEVPVNE